jgi:hypothetical protein
LKNIARGLNQILEQRLSIQFGHCKEQESRDKKKCEARDGKNKQDLRRLRADRAMERPVEGRERGVFQEEWWRSRKLFTILPWVVSIF